MVARFLVQCRTCSNQLAVRIQVGGGRQPFLLSCPHCRTQLRAVLTADPATGGSLASEDFDVLQGSGVGDFPAVTVATDIPVHKSLLQRSANETLLTPFIYLSSAMGSGLVGQLMESIETMREERESVFPPVRRASSSFTRGQDQATIVALVPLYDRNSHFGNNPAAALSHQIDRLFAPFDVTVDYVNAVRETRRLMRRARRVQTTPDLVGSFLTSGLVEHRARVLESVMSVLDDVAALFPALFVERMRDPDDRTSYRVMRDDFDHLKSRYQDLFELASRSLAYEPWLADFPAARRLYENMKRATRNDIGHRLVRYEFESGDLVYEDGGRESYLAFLVDYLNAARLSHYLANLVLMWLVPARVT